MMFGSQQLLRNHYEIERLFADFHCEEVRELVELPACQNVPENEQKGPAIQPASQQILRNHYGVHRLFVH
jgi:hypothetical protein